ncbi:MAG: sulfatase-like hydrolase/transferase [Gemmatimonadetes bacterium]|nr:sulfatase-like hydrolase/transferase [Gemmatimonadota bacterium]
MRKQMLPLFPITLLGVAVDLWLRPTLDLRLTQWAWWGLSVAFSLVMWQGLFAISSRLRPRWQAAFVISVGVVTAALSMVWLDFHAVFYCWPTAYALVHSAGHPREAWGYILNEADWGDAIVWVVVVVFVVGWWCYKLRPGRQPAHGRVLAALCLAGAVAFGAVHRHASIMVPDAAAAKLAIDFAVHSLVGGVHGRLLQASRPAASAIYSGAPVDASAPNLIVVLGESVALSRMDLYGYERQTTPRLAALRKARPADWVQMEKAVSNATATKVALPAMLTGLFPSRAPVEQHTFPLLWHYAHAAGYQTALISAQSYAWNNLEGFFVDDALDHAFTLERSDAEIVNSEGMDDRRMMAETLATIDRFAARGPFVVALQFNCTHYPGYSPPDWQPWPDASYDNAVAYMDHLLGRLFDHLAAQGLAENTIVLFVADHGEDLDGVHKLHRTDSYYQTAIAVPFFAVVPERQRQRLGTGWGQWRQNAQMRVALTDLVPTALDLLGLSADSTVAAWQERLDGRSLLRPLDPERLIVVVNTDEHVQWSRKGYAVVADDWKYINYSWRGSMLFDLATDELEQRDLLAGGESALSRAGQRHLRRVRALVAETPVLADIHVEY